MSQWPFLPDRLTELLSEELVQFVQSGSAVEMNMPVAIIEFREGQGGSPEPYWIPSQDRWLNYSDFCYYFRNSRLMSGQPAFPGAEAACRKCDADNAYAFHMLLLDPQSGQDGVAYKCHMGIRDYIAPIYVAGRCVAYIFAGQRVPNDDPECRTIRRHIQALGSGDMAHIRIGTGTKEELIQKLSTLHVESADLLRKVQSEARRIGSMAERYRELIKVREQERFLQTCRLNHAGSQQDLKEALASLLRSAIGWCQLSFACVFTTEKPGDNILKLQTHHGLPDNILCDLPHFNWTKGGLPSGTVQPSDYSSLVSLKKGIKGGSAHALCAEVSYMGPLALSSGHRAVVCVGGLTADTIDENLPFLHRIVRHLCYPYLEQLDKLQLIEREEQWEQAMALIGHQIRGSLHPISTEADILRHYAILKKDWITPERANEAATIIREEAVALGEHATDALEFWRWMMGRGERSFSRQNLGRLLTKSANALREFSTRAQLKIIVEPTVRNLPEVEVIGRTMEVAIRNILENAIKYAFDGKYIQIKGYTRYHVAYVEIEDFGIGIPEDEREKVFEKRYRGQHRGRKMPREGEGLGAWQAREILRAHGGDIFCTSRSGSREPRPGNVHGFRTIFTIYLPIEQRFREDI